MTTYVKQPSATPLLAGTYLGAVEASARQARLLQRFAMLLIGEEKSIILMDFVPGLFVAPNSMLASERRRLRPDGARPESGGGGDEGGCEARFTLCLLV